MALEINEPFILPDTMEVAFTAEFFDAVGNAVQVVNPAAKLTNETIAKVALTDAPAEGKAVGSVSGIVTALGPIGSTELAVIGKNADGSIATGLRAIVTVTSGATTVKITMGKPTVIVKR